MGQEKRTEIRSLLLFRLWDSLKERRGNFWLFISIVILSCFWLKRRRSGQTQTQLQQHKHNNSHHNEHISHPSFYFDLGDRITLTKGERIEYKEGREGEETKKPLIIILGWGGAKRAQLRHIINWYSAAPTSSSSSPTAADLLGCSSGFDVLSYVPSMANFGSNFYEMECAKRFLHVLTMYSSSSSSSSFPIPIFFHTFSNNGTRFLIRILEELASFSSSLFQVKGYIFDSAPRFQIPDGFNNSMSSPETLRLAETPRRREENGEKGDVLTRALSVPSQVWHMGRQFSRPIVAITLQKAQYEHWFLTPALATVFSSLALFSMLLRGSTQPSSELFERTTRLFSSSSSHSPSPSLIASAPHLYIFSHADKLIESQHILHWISILRNIRKQENKERRRSRTPTPTTEKGKEADEEEDEGLEEGEHGVETLQFEDSAHVNHFRTKREDYTTRITDFIQRNSY